MIDRIFNSIEWIFHELRLTKGESSLQFSKISLDNTLGVLRSIYWLARLTFKKL